MGFNVQPKSERYRQQVSQRQGVSRGCLSAKIAPAKKIDAIVRTVNYLCAPPRAYIRIKQPAFKGFEYSHRSHQGAGKTESAQSINQCAPVGARSAHHEIK